VTPTIRTATPADIGELARLRWQLYSEQEPHDERFETYLGRFTAFAVDALSRDDWRVWVADADGRPVAAMWLQTVPRVPAPGRGDPRPIGYLTNAYVEPDHRSRGLGSQMLQTVVAHCEAAGFVLVMAWPANDAYGFYERNGFTRPPDPLVRRMEP
jgi:GNAT superfamily N-acetyltransferase